MTNLETQFKEDRSWPVFGASGLPYPFEFLWPKKILGAYLNRWLPANGVGNTGMIVAPVGECSGDWSFEARDASGKNLDDLTIVTALGRVIDGRQHQPMPYGQAFRDAYDATWGDKRTPQKGVLTGIQNRQVDALVITTNLDSEQNALAYLGKRAPEDFIAPLREMSQYIMRRSGIELPASAPETAAVQAA